ncbi:hypothetical protein P170DRAFT_23925 [Aspergillus steynii IBT 23096]|uniref:Uncharacterized protein n=1 Tax=Aspergillus steynii IBT 23096 TaxID=1392250 RepID=A0A2I2GP84_9EURO|nr:uncharacterized protein P170DRAFT_23925 [Aspergillus steynii IBT 23096]PLB54687.1 hypothetical protein P170DRAFT_23925 [Aspergillus steynii IBT 23096]
MTIHPGRGNRTRPHSENSAYDRLARALGTVNGIMIVDRTCPPNRMTFDKRNIITGRRRGRQPVGLFVRSLVQSWQRRAGEKRSANINNDIQGYEGGLIDNGEIDGITAFVAVGRTLGFAAPRRAELPDPARPERMGLRRVPDRSMDLGSTGLHEGMQRTGEKK